MSTRVYHPLKKVQKSEYHYSLDDLDLVLAEVEKITQAPHELIMSAMLGSITTVSQHFVNVEFWKTKSAKPVSLYFITLAESGERKSTCDKMFMSSLEKWEKEQRIVYEEAKKSYQTLQECWQDKMKGLKARLRQCAKDEDCENVQKVEAQIRTLKNEEPHPPKLMKLIMQDATDAGLKHKLHQHLPTGGLVDAEGGQVLMAGAMKNTEKLNKLWDGDPLTIERFRDSSSFTLEDARLSISLMVQPATFKKYIEGKGSIAVENGFLARCLFVQVETTQGQRMEAHGDQDVIATPSLDKFHLRYQSLLKEISDKNNSLPSKLTRHLLHLSDESKNHLINFQNEIESQIASGHKFQRIRGAASKMADNALRLAGVLHFWCVGQDSLEIREEFMVRAIEIARYHLDEYCRYFHILHPAVRLEQESERLYSWLCERTFKNGYPLKKSYVEQRAPNTMRRIENLQPLLEDLVARKKIQLFRYNNCKSLYVGIVDLQHFGNQLVAMNSAVDQVVPAVSPVWVTNSNTIPIFSGAVNFK